MRSVVLPTLLLTAVLAAATLAHAGPTTQPSEKAEADEVLALLKAGDYAKGIPLAEETYRKWRERYAGARRSSYTSTQPADPEIKYLRKPSPEVYAGAEAVVNAIYAIDDPAAVPHLTAVKVPEIVIYTSAAVMRIGVEMCRKDKVVPGIRTILAGCRARRVREVASNTLDMSYPKLLGFRLAPNPLGRLQSALGGKDPIELAKAYNLIPPDEDKDNITQTIMYASFAWTPKKGDPPLKSLAVLAAALQDRRSPRRRLAATLLHTRYERKSEYRDPAVAILRRHLTDKDVEVQFYVAVSLMRWADPSGLDVIMSVPRPRAFLPTQYPLETIGTMGLRRASGWIIQFAYRNPSATERCLTALWRMCDEEAVAYLGSIVINKKVIYSQKSIAANALAATMSDDAVTYVMRGLKEGSPRLRQQLMLLITEFRPKHSLPVLVKDMEANGLLKAKPEANHNRSIGWNRLRFCTGIADPAAAYLKDKTQVEKAMEVYWNGKRERRRIINQMRHYTYAEPDLKKVTELRGELIELARKAPQSCFTGFW